MNVDSPPHTIGKMGDSPIKSEDSSKIESNENSTDLPEEILEPATETPAETTETPAETTETPAETTETKTDTLENPDIAQPGV